MLLILVLLSSVLAARAQCEACVNNRCYSRKHLALTSICDDIAVDQLHNILYVQFKIQTLEQMQRGSGLTVDHEAHVLYNADPTSTVYKINLHKFTRSETASYRIYDDVDLMFYKGSLFYTKKWSKGMFVIDTKTKQERRFPLLDNYKIIEFVVDRNNLLYFVANAVLYKFNITNGQPPEILMRKIYVLSTDKRGDLYLGDAPSNIIYKLNYETNKLTEYAAYTNGINGKFLFDANNNIVFQDFVGSVSLWQSKHTECTIVRSHDKYLVKEDPSMRDIFKD